MDALNDGGVFPHLVRKGTVPLFPSALFFKGSDRCAITVYRPSRGLFGHRFGLFLAPRDAGVQGCCGYAGGLKRVGVVRKGREWGKGMYIRERLGGLHGRTGNLFN